MVAAQPPPEPVRRSSVDVIIIERRQLARVFQTWHQNYRDEPDRFESLDELGSEDYARACVLEFDQLAEGLTLEAGDLCDIATGFGVEFGSAALRELANSLSRLASGVQLGDFSADEADRRRPMPESQPLGQLLKAIHAAAARVA
jgi:hypothetical protein